MTIIMTIVIYNHLILVVEATVVTCTDSYDCMGPSLPGRPGQLEEVEASFVADSASDTVRRLSDGVAVKG
jgi:hypothetical protein